jgi:hypothetical protein
MPKRLSKKRSADANELMHQLGEASTLGQVETSKPTRSEISRVMSAMGRKGGKKSAKARMEQIPAERRSQIAANAARAMWAKKKSAEVE